MKPALTPEHCDCENPLYEQSSKQREVKWPTQQIDHGCMGMLCVMVTLYDNGVALQMFIGLC